MSAFGDEKSHMNDLYDELNRFVNDGGSLAELFAVLKYFFSDYEIRLKELEELEKTMIITTNDKPISLSNTIHMDVTDKPWLGIHKVDVYYNDNEKGE